MVGLSPEFLYVSLGVERFSSELPEMGWYKCVCVCVRARARVCVCVECLYMIKPIVFSFCSVRS